jgi:hypothetical protein
MCVNSILAIFGSTFSRHIHLVERGLWWAMRHSAQPLRACGFADARIGV